MIQSQEGESRGMHVCVVYHWVMVDILLIWKFITYEHAQSILSACHLSSLSARQISTSRYHSSLGEGAGTIYAGTQTSITHKYVFTDVLHLPKSARTLSQGVGICTTSFGSVSVTFSRMSKVTGVILYVGQFYIFVISATQRA